LEELEEDSEDGVREQEVPFPQQPPQQQNGALRSPLPSAAQVATQDPLGQGVSLLEGADPDTVAAPSFQNLRAENPSGPRLVDEPPQTLQDEVDPLEEKGAPLEASPETSSIAPQNVRVDLGLAALSAAPRSSHSMAQGSNRLDNALKKAWTTPFPVTVPGMSPPLRIDAKSVFPPAWPKNTAAFGVPESSETGSFQVEQSSPPISPVRPEEFTTCHPPCIQGRGVCNDNLCFCKTPFTGTTCQHKLGKYARVGYVMVVAASVVFLVFGVIAAQILHALVTGQIEKRLTWLGQGSVNREVWHPPEKAAKGGNKAVGHAVPPPADNHPHSDH